MKAAKRFNGHNVNARGNGHAARDATGRYLKNHGAPGPGRPPGRTVPQILLDAARTLAEPLEAAKDAVVIAREFSPAALLRVVEILHDETAEHSDQLAAARLILERGYGMPSQAVATLNMNATLTPEQTAAGADAFARVLALRSAGRESSSE